MRKNAFVLVAILVLSFCIWLQISFSDNAGPTPNTTAVKNSDLFHNHLKWKKWDIKDFDPIYILLKNQVTISYSKYNSINYPTIITDVNWDSLPDIIITKYKQEWRLRPIKIWGRLRNWWTQEYHYALLINKWNLNYDIAYRCIDEHAHGVEEYWYKENIYYGDCVK